jgi:hypothetical protein
VVERDVVRVVVRDSQDRVLLFPTYEVASPELGSGGRSSGGKAAGPGPDIDESRRFDYGKEDYFDFR